MLSVLKYLCKNPQQFSGGLHIWNRWSTNLYYSFHFAAVRLSEATLASIAFSKSTTTLRALQCFTALKVMTKNSMILKKIVWKITRMCKREVHYNLVLSTYIEYLAIWRNLRTYIKYFKKSHKLLTYLLIFLCAHHIRLCNILETMYNKRY